MKKIEVQFDETETFFEAVVEDTEAVMAEIAEQEYKWGDQRTSH